MADIVVKNGLIVTMNEENLILKNGGLAIEEDKIIDVGDSERIRKQYSADIELDAKGKAVLPGFVNTHTHLFQNLLKGRRDDLPLFDWVSDVEMPLVKAQFQDGQKGDFELGYYAALLGCVESLESGTTCLVDMDLRNPKVPEAFQTDWYKRFLRDESGGSVGSFRGSAPSGRSDGILRSDIEEVAWGGERPDTMHVRAVNSIHLFERVLGGNKGAS